MAWLPTLGIPLSRRESVLLVLSVLQLLLVVIDLGIMGSAADGMKSGLHFISIPGKLVYNIVAAVITIFVLPVIIILDIRQDDFWHQPHHVEPNAPARRAPGTSTRAGAGRQPSRYSPWLRLTILSILSAFWIGAVASSVYTCSDLCSATPRNGTLNFAGLCCDCFTSSLMQCEFAGDGSTTTYIEQHTGRYEATQALDATIMVLLFISAGICLSFKWKESSNAERREYAEATRADPDRRISVGHINGDIEM